LALGVPALSLDSAGSRIIAQKVTSFPEPSPAKTSAFAETEDGIENRDYGACDSVILREMDDNHWRDVPSDRHDTGCSMSFFSDGHAEYHR
jgi:hypothetical protein